LSITKKPKVCLLISTFYPFVGGGETHALLLCKELIKSGSEIFVITRRTDNQLSKKEVIEDVPVFRVGPCGFKRLGKYLMLFPVFIKLLLLRNHYDVILVSGLRTLSIPAIITSSLLGKKCVLRAASCGELSGAFIWDSPHLEGQDTKIKIFKSIINIRNRLFLKADGFLAISSAIHDEYRESGVAESKIRVINNGADTDKFTPIIAADKKSLRQKLNLPDKVIFSYAGKLNKGKGLIFLLKVWKDFFVKHPNTHLLLIGSGKGSFLSCESKLRAFVLENNLIDSITFTGYVENVYEYLQASDIFIFPSENESLSNALIEALACGLPCLASNIGGIPDTVKDNQNGYLLPPQNKDAWVGAMNNMMESPDLAQKMGQQGRKRILKRNSINSVAKQYLDFMQSV